MLEKPWLGVFNEAVLSTLDERYGALQMLGQESRSNFSATFPVHNRYFSNGDKPLVLLVKHKGKVELCYNGENFVLGDKEFVFFDDTIRHSWVMNRCDLDIYYYRKSIADHVKITTGDYCLDNYF